MAEPYQEATLQQQFDVNLLRNEWARVSLVVGFLGVLTLLVIARLLLALSGDAGPEALQLLGLPVLILVLLLAFEMLYRRFIVRRLEAQVSMSSALWYVATCLEFGALALGFYLSLEGRSGSYMTGLPGQVAILLIFVMLSAFRLHFFITAFTGLLAGTTYLLIAYLTQHPEGMNPTGAPVTEAYFWVAGYIFGGGILAGLIAARVRQQTLKLAQTLQERLRLEGEVVHIAGEEQRRIGQDLHDGLGSHLTGVSMYARGLARRLERGKEIRREEMQDLASMVEEAVAQARLLSRGLYPVNLDEGGLPAALIDLAVIQQTVSGITCAFTCEGDAQRLGARAAEHLYRIAQEAVANATKHARPGRIDIRLVFASDHLELTVHDDGVGLPEEVGEQGFGMRSMAQRARLLGGTFSLEGAPGEGTQITCLLPSEALLAAREHG